MPNIANISGNLLTDSGIDLSTLPSGSGTLNYLPKWTSSSALGNSLVQDNGTRLGINNFSSNTNSLFNVESITPGAIAVMTLTNVGFTSNKSAMTFSAGTGGGGIDIGPGSNFQFSISQGGQTRINIANSSNVLIGTTTDAGYRLDVSGTFRSTGTTYLATGGNNVLINSTNDTGQRLQVNGTALISGTTAINSTIPGTLWSQSTFLFIGQSGVLLGESASIATALSSNGYYNGTNNVRKSSGFSSQVYLDPNGDINFLSAGTGAAGSTISYATNAVIKNSGNVGIGTTSPAQKLDVSGISRFAGLIDGNYGEIRIQGGTGNNYLSISGFSLREWTISTAASGGGALYLRQAQLYFQNLGGSYYGGTNNGGAFFLGTAWDNNSTRRLDVTALGSSAAIFRNTSGTEIFNIANTGNILVGTGGVDAGYKLDVNGTARVSGALAMGAGGTLTGALTVQGGGYFIGNSSNGFRFNNNTDASTLFYVDNGGTCVVGGQSFNTSAIFQVNSTTKGLLLPRMTGAQAEAIATPADGLVVYVNSGDGVTITSTGFWGRDAGAWVKLS